MHQSCVRVGLEKRNEAQRIRFVENAAFYRQDRKVSGSKSDLFIVYPDSAFRGLSQFLQADAGTLCLNNARLSPFESLSSHYV
jgi:hypothetical protein